MSNWALLDQHEFALQDSDSLEARLLGKTLEAIRIQRLRVVVSDLHFRETASIPCDKKKERVLDILGRLTAGRVSGDFSDAIADDIRRAIAVKTNTPYLEDVSSALRISREHWDVPSPIRLTNAWRLALVQSMWPRVEARNLAYRQILESQAGHVDARLSTNCYVTRVRDLTRRDLIKAVDQEHEDELVLRALRDQRTDVFATKIQRSLNAPEQLAPYGHLICSLATDTTAPISLSTLRKLFKDGVKFSQTLMISTACEGALLEMWSKGSRKNPKKFGQNFGVSRQSDIEHVSVFAPRVDALTTDRDMLNFCACPMIKSALSSSGCRIFATSNYCELEQWLDMLISHPELPAVATIRRSVYGLSRREDTEDTDQMVQEVCVMLLRQAVIRCMKLRLLSITRPTP